MNECTACSKQARNGYLCGTCTGRLRNALAMIPDLFRELNTTITRTDKTAQTTPNEVRAGGSEESPLPVNLDAAEVKRQLHALLRLWSHTIRQVIGTNPESFRTDALAYHVQVSIPAVVLWPSIGNWYVDLREAMQRGWAAVDLPTDPPARVYCGPCLTDGCDQQLWAAPGDFLVVCRCGARVDVTHRRASKLHAARDEVATATAISRALSAHEVPVTVDRIYQWKHRGRLIPAATGPTGQMFYRLGDVLDLAAIEGGKP